jgi:hypothetical protein
MTVMNQNNALRLIVSIVLLMAQNIAVADKRPAPELGRLFTQPATRAQLDLNRKNPTLVKKIKPIKHIKKQVVTAQPTLPLPDPITMQGYVKRSNGVSTIWINHKPVQENTMVNDVKIGRLTKKYSSKSKLVNSDAKMDSVDQLVINIPANGKYIKLKAGQAYNAEQNEVKEVTTLAQEHQVELIKSDPSTTDY